MVWNIPVACNRASADFIISSPLMSTEYERLVPDYSKYRARLAVRYSLNVISPEISRMPFGAYVAAVQARATRK